MVCALNSIYHWRDVMKQKTHYRTVWLSDIHLGSKDCKAEYLLDFLDHNIIDTLFLVGDIVDLWALSKRFLWPAAHNILLHKLLSLPEEDNSGHRTRVVYLPGNHDDPLQKYDKMTFGHVEIHREYIYQTAKGKKLLLLHGDQFDNEVYFGRVKNWIGDKAYVFLLLLNRGFNAIRTKYGYPYWSLAGHIKTRIRGANDAIARYRQAAITRAKKENVDGIVCGHIHHPEIMTIDGITYYNDGDWVESCSALTEDKQGNIHLIFWSEEHATKILDTVESSPKTAKVKQAA
jgi:UDP-2,3-diacylglucosamine pyrophosphatase LpxH